MRRVRGFVALALLVLLAGWEPFRAPNLDVEAGNKALAEGRYDDALAAYDRAAKAGDVDAAGLAYDRGSAKLRKAGEAKDPAEKTKLTESALEDLKQAVTSRDPKIRGQAHYNRGNTLLGQDKLEDAIEAYKNALRDLPQLDDARLNLELALRRRQKQQQQQQQQGQGQGQQGQGQQGQGQQGQGQQGQGQQGQGQQGQGQNQQGQGQGQQQQGQGQGQQQQQQQGQGSGSGQQGQQGQNQQQQGQGSGSGQQKDPQQGQGQQQQQPQQGPRRRQQGQGQGQGPRSPSERKLDDLEEFSRQLQRDGARRRASGRARDPEKDW